MLKSGESNQNGTFRQFYSSIVLHWI